MIKNITGVEAMFLDRFYQSLVKQGQLLPLENLHDYSVDKDQLIRIFGITAEQYVLAANNLMRLQLIAPAILKAGISMGSESVTIFKGTDAVTLTPLGAKFVEACIK